MTKHKSEEPRHIPVESDEAKTKPQGKGDKVHYEETAAGLAGLPDRKKGQDESQPPEEKPEEPEAIPGHLHR